VDALLGELGLSTVCTSARCPNKGECFSRGTATFMILGEVCTRNCGFCAVASGSGAPVNPDEPLAVASACAEMGIRHAVVTSVTRDDLPDGGAGQFAEVRRAIRSLDRGITVELLVPDFRGDWSSLDTVLSAEPDVLNHNVETVPRLYPHVRSGADYQRSLDLLARAADKTTTKSGLMVGLGETRTELTEVMGDLSSVGCKILTVGQYLAPSNDHLPVERYLEPMGFDEIRDEAIAMGFSAVASGPFVRSSYRAEGVFASASS